MRDLSRERDLKFHDLSRVDCTRMRTCTVCIHTRGVCVCILCVYVRMCVYVYVCMCVCVNVLYVSIQEACVYYVCIMYVCVYIMCVCTVCVDRIISINSVSCRSPVSIISALQEGFEDVQAQGL